MMPPKPSGLRLTLFGGPHLVEGGRPIPLSPQQSALLGLLATRGQRGIRTGELLSFLWSDGSDDVLRKRLSQLIYTLNQRVGGDRLVCAIGRGYVLAQARLTSDLEDFLELLGRRAAVQAAELATRGFLAALERPPTWEFEHWVHERDLKFRSDARTVAAESWSEGEQRVDWKMAEDAAEAWLRLDPQHELVLRKLLQAMALRGRVREAEARYEAFRELSLAEDPEWLPEAETVGIVSQLRELGSRREKRVAVRSPEAFQDPPLIGRTRELGLLTEITRDPPSGGVTTVLVSGASGIGKTRLVREALARAPFDGIRVLQGACSDFEQAIPLSPLLGSLTPDWAQRKIRGVGAPWDSLLRSLLPGLWHAELEGAPAFSAPLEQVPHATREAFLRLFVHLAQSDPLVLFLDDFHWIDLTSLSILDYMRGRWSGRGLLVVLAYRPDEVAPASPLARWIDPSGPGSDLMRLDLKPLTPKDTRTLLTHAITLRASSAQSSMIADSVGALVELVAGHPLLALEAVRGWGSPEDSVSPELSQSPVPDSVRAIVTRRFSHLSPSGQHVLSCLSVSEKPLPLSVLEQSCALLPQAISEALDEAVGAQFVTVSPKGIGFRHGLIREAVYQGMRPGRKLTAHRSVAEALISLGDTKLLPDISLHLFAAAEPERAMPYVLQAAQSATDAGGWAEAKRLLELALEVGPQGGQRGEVAELLGRLLFMSGDYREAAAVWTTAEKAFQLVGAEERALLARLRVLEARRLQPESDREALLDQVRTLREDALDRDLRRLVAECLNVEVRMLDDLRRIDDVRVLASTAHTHVGADDLDTHLQFLFVSMLEAVYGDPASAVRMADRAVQMASDHGRDDLVLKALNWKIIAYYHQARLNRPEGRSLITRARRVARNSADPDQRFWLEGNVGAWHVEAGNHEAAGRSFDRAEAALGSLLAPHRRRNLLFNRGQLALEKGELEEAEQLFAQSVSIGEVSTHEAHRSVALSGLGLTLLQRGRFSQAMELHSVLPPRPTHWTYDPFLWLAFDVMLAHASGSIEEALSLIRKQEPMLRASVPTAWMRLRLLCMDLEVRHGLPIHRRAISDLEAFLIDHQIDQRLIELRTLCTSAEVSPS